VTEPTDSTSHRGYGAQPQYGQQYSAAPPTQQYAGGYAAQPSYAAAPVAGPPPSNAGWAVACILFFWPLAFAAFNHLHNIYPYWAMGDHQGAQEASARVKSLGKIALWIFLGFMIFFFVVYGFIIAAALSTLNSVGGYR
jgi:interferon-induced transmembrane protein